MRSDVGDVTQQLYSSLSLQREQNLSALKRILQAIEVLGRLGQTVCLGRPIQSRSSDDSDRLFVQAEEVDGRPIQMPRIRNRQRHRPNLPADSALVYYRRVLFNPFLDIRIVQLQERFASTSAKALLFSALTSASVWRGTSPQLRKG